MYSYFDANGPRAIPSRTEVVELASQHGIVTALLADANVCLDLVGLSTQTLQPAMHDKVRAFVAGIEASGADVIPGFGLVELSLDRASWKIDAKKLESIQRQVTLAIDSAPGRVAQRGSSAAKEEAPPDVDMFSSFVPTLKIFYASLLRIALISSTALNRDSAVRNLQEFLQWLTQDLNCVSVLSLQAAVAIFGGDSLARKLIGVGKAQPSLEDVWGGAWDLFYVHQLYYSVWQYLDGVPQHLVFVTRDRACYGVFSRSSLRGGIRFSKTRNTHIVGIDTEYPHYANRQEEIAKMLAAAMLPRVSKLARGKRMSMKHLAKTLDALEREWHNKHPKGAT